MSGYRGRRRSGGCPRRTASNGRPAPRPCLVTLCLALSALACARDREPGLSEDAGRTLRVLYAADERSLHPASDDVPLRLVFSPLVSYPTMEASACGEPEPGLAVAWEHSEDWRTWTVRLRENLTWHDGAPVTAEDVRFTVELWKHPEVGHWAGEPIDSVVVLDERTFRVHYARPSRELLNGWDVFYPAHLLRGLDPDGFWDWDFWERPVGNGPFRYRGHTRRTMMEFEPHASFRGAKSGFERLVLKWGGGGALVELESGGVDAVESAPPGEARRLADVAEYRVHAVPYPGGVRLLYNQRVPPLDRVGVRRAVTMAIDRRELLRTLDLPYDLPITDGLHTPCQFSRRRVSPPVSFDPRTAERLLAESGWVDRDGDGIRERGERPLAFTVTAPTDWLQAREAAVYLQQALRSIGIGVEVESLEFRLVGERLAAGEFEALIWITGPWPDHHLERFGEGNPLGFRNPRLSALLEAAREAMEPAGRDSLYRLASDVFEQEMPATWLYPKTDLHVTRPGLEGYDASHGDLIMNLGRIRMEER